MTRRSSVLKFSFADEESIPLALTKKDVVIKVLGVGGGGTNAVNTYTRLGIKDVETIAANTDVQVLETSSAHRRLVLGSLGTTRGWGAGADPEVGRAAAEESAEAIRDMIRDADLLFITAGMGGGTGTGAAPVIARIAREMDILTVGVVTRPFFFEGPQRRRVADAGVAALQANIHTLVVIGNDKVLQCMGDRDAMAGFEEVDRVLCNAVNDIVDLIRTPGYINVDFADLKTIMRTTGNALFGTAMAEGEGRAVAAVKQALASPMLDRFPLREAGGVLVNVIGGRDLLMREFNEVVGYVNDSIDQERCNFIFGYAIKEGMKGQIKVSVIATGFARPAVPAQARPQKAVAAAPIQKLAPETLKSFEQQAYERMQRRFTGEGVTRAEGVEFQIPLFDEKVEQALTGVGDGRVPQTGLPSTSEPEPVCIEDDDFVRMVQEVMASDSRKKKL